MKIRFVLVAALVASVALGTAGCNLIQPQATRIAYDPSDGVSVNVGTLALRNVVLLSDDGERGNLLFSAINTTGATVTLNLSFTANGMANSQAIDVESSERPIGFGTTGEPQVQLEGFDVAPGGMLQMSFQAGDSETRTLFVPVLTTAQPQYNGLTPTPTPTPTPTFTSTSTPLPEATPTEG